jgi:hypothetical protein
LYDYRKVMAGVELMSMLNGRMKKSRRVVDCAGGREIVLPQQWTVCFALLANDSRVL